jgi:hypothetical protein
MSDDDFLTDGAVDAVLAEIDSGHSLIIVNAEVRDRNLSELVGASILRHRANRIYLPVEGEAFFVDTANYLSFIGCVIIRKDLWCSRDSLKASLRWGASEKARQIWLMLD